MVSCATFSGPIPMVRALALCLLSTFQTLFRSIGHRGRLWRVTTRRRLLVFGEASDGLLRSEWFGLHCTCTPACHGGLMVDVRYSVCSYLCNTGL